MELFTKSSRTLFAWNKVANILFMKFPAEATNDNGQRILLGLWYILLSHMAILSQRHPSEVQGPRCFLGSNTGDIYESISPSPFHQSLLQVGKVRGKSWVTTYCKYWVGIFCISLNSFWQAKLLTNGQGVECDKSLKVKQRSMVAHWRCTLYWTFFWQEWRERWTCMDVQGIRIVTA